MRFKFDGFRIQIHKLGLAVNLFGKNGRNLTTRFRTVHYLTRAVFALSTASGLLPT